MTTPQFRPPRQQPVGSADQFWLDPNLPDKPWRTPRPQNSSPATNRFLLVSVVLLVLVAGLWSTGALKERTDTSSFYPAGTALAMGSFEASFDEAVAERTYDGTWELHGYGTIRGLGAQTSYAPDAVMALPDGSLFHEAASQVGGTYSAALQPGLTSSIEVTLELPAQWEPQDSVCVGFHRRTQQKARLGDDGKTWVAEPQWACNWVTVVQVEP